jgi:hypothetical protein
MKARTHFNQLITFKIIFHEISKIHNFHGYVVLHRVLQLISLMNELFFSPAPKSLEQNQKNFLVN